MRQPRRDAARHAVQTGSVYYQLGSRPDCHAAFFSGCCKYAKYGWKDKEWFTTNCECQFPTSSSLAVCDSL